MLNSCHAWTIGSQHLYRHAINLIGVNELYRVVIKIRQPIEFNKPRPVVSTPIIGSGSDIR